VEEEDTQNKELVELSRQILSLTKEVRALTAGGAAGTRPAGTHAGLHTLRRRCGGLRRASLALACLRKADLRRGQSILVYGASGSTGTAGVQLARHFGAHVTAVCDTKNLELAASLGADDVIDRRDASRMWSRRPGMWKPGRRPGTSS
jgi:NADPH:quinone reductase-like Zn-dependent oxidoreductase